MTVHGLSYSIVGSSALFLSGISGCVNKLGCLEPSDLSGRYICTTTAYGASTKSDTVIVEETKPYHFSLTTPVFSTSVIATASVDPDHSCRKIAIFNDQVVNFCITYDELEYSSERYYNSGSIPSIVLLKGTRIK